MADGDNDLAAYGDVYSPGEIKPFKNTAATEIPDVADIFISFCRVVYFSSIGLKEFHEHFT